jgi:hypothetical protein
VHARSRPKHGFDQLGAGVEQMLAVVQDEQQPLLGEVTGQRFERRDGCLLA